MSTNLLLQSPKRQSLASGALTESGPRAKYVPVVLYRKEERLGLNRLVLPRGILPLIEVIAKKPQGGTASSWSTYIRDFEAMQVPVMVDIPLHLKPTSTSRKSIQSFLTQMRANPLERVRRLSSLNAVPDLIPVVSYDPTDSVTITDIVRQSQVLRDTYAQLAFRVFPVSKSRLPEYLEPVCSQVESACQKGDIIIFDIDEEDHWADRLTEQYSLLTTLSDSKGLFSVLIRSAIPRNLFNSNFHTEDGFPDELPIDNSLRDVYVKYGFDCFGDYACLKNELPGGAPTPSAGLIFHSRQQNKYYGFGREQLGWSQYPEYILPNLLRSRVWREQPDEHKDECPGCMTVRRIHDGLVKSDDPGTWKRIAFTHYIQSVAEGL